MPCSKRFASWRADSVETARRLPTLPHRVDFRAGEPWIRRIQVKIDRSNRKLEIGHTWLFASVQRTGVNTEAKYLLLRHAFDAMDCVRVQFTTDELNEKSRAVILRIGARREGIVRHERIMPAARKRNSVRFSIIDAEWPEVRARLEQKLARTEG